MAQCLMPRFVRRPDKNKAASHLIDIVSRANREYGVSPYFRDCIAVPCGKCINCLKNRQSALVSRCCEESNKRGLFGFVTLTYDEQHLPLAQSAWRCNVDTGECERVGLEHDLPFCRFDCSLEPEIIHGVRYAFVHDGVKESMRTIRLDSDVSSQMRLVVPSDVPRYIDKPLFGGQVFDGYYYFARITPSLNRLDVRLWLKRARVAYEREHGVHLDFSYVCVGEYGPRTCRPHYHLAFFGLDRSVLDYFVSLWDKGSQVDVKMVNRVNEDGSDGFQIASRYIGKYMSKGKFECESVKNHCAEKPRLMQSIGIGKSLIDKVRDYCCCFDMYGKYDIDSFFCPSLRRRLNDVEIRAIINEVPKRLTYNLNDNVKLPIPRLFRRAIFYVQKKGFDGQTFTVPSTLWSLVSYDLQHRFMADCLQKFDEFRARYPDRSYNEVSSLFQDFSASFAAAASVAGEARLQTFYQQSKF